MFFNVVIFLILSLFCNNLHSLTVGSDTTPSRQVSVMFPSGTDNQILGFAALDAGFTLADAHTSCSFDAFFPMSGVVNFRGGSFYLDNDFRLSSDAYITNYGVVYGNQNSVVFSSITTATIFPQTSTSNPFSIFDLTVFFPNDTSIASPLYVNGMCALIGSGNTFALNKNKPIIVQPYSELLVQNIYIEGLGGNSLSCADNSSVIILRDVVLSLDHTYNFSQGSILFQGDIVLRGTNKFVYSSTVASTIGHDTTLLCDFGTSISFYSPRNFRTPLYFSDFSSRLYLNGCSLFVSRTGLQLSQGSIYFDNNVTLSCEGQTASTGLSIRYDTNAVVQSRAYVDLYGLITVG